MTPMTEYGRDQNMGLDYTRVLCPGYIHGFDGERHGEHVWRCNTWLWRAGWLLSLAWLCCPIKFDKQTVRGPR